MRRIPALVALVVLTAAPLRAQHLRDKIGDLFIFSQGDAPLHLGGSADPNNPETIREHGDHFIPAAVGSNATIISFYKPAVR